MFVVPLASDARTRRQCPTARRIAVSRRRPFSLFRGFQKVRNAGSRRSAVRAEPIKEHETVDMKLAHSFSKVRACIGLEFE